MQGLQTGFEECLFRIDHEVVTSEFFYYSNMYYKEMIELRIHAYFLYLKECSGGMLRILRYNAITEYE